MNSLVLYFSGTGNTRYLADRIGEGLPERMRGPKLSMETASPDALPYHDILFLGYPVYETDAPGLVQDFVRRIPRVRKKGAFLFCSHGGVPGNAPRRGLKRLAETGYTPLGYLTVGMGDTLGVTLFPKTSPMVRLMENRERAVRRSVSAFLERRVSRIPPDCAPEGLERFRIRLPLSVSGLLLDGLWRSMNRRWIGGLRSSLKADESCVLCGLCVRECPVQAVYIENDRVLFGESCMLCGRCVNRCPSEAIQLGSRTVGKYRWKGYPEASGSERMLQ